jgi:hypothetical protein
VVVRDGGCGILQGRRRWGVCPLGQSALLDLTTNQDRRGWGGGGRSRAANGEVVAAAVTACCRVAPVVAYEREGVHDVRHAP